MSFVGLGAAFIGKDHLTHVCSHVTHLTHLSFQYDVILTAVNVCQRVNEVLCLEFRDSRILSCVHVFCLEFCDSRILSGIL
jgi:hypothetical protein